MKEVIEFYFDKLLHKDSDSMAELYTFMVYDIPLSVVDEVKKLLLPGKTVAFFSGSWRLDLDATYLELKMFKDSLIKFHPLTLFVDHNNHQVFDYTMKKLAPTNFLILHNDWWIGHCLLEDLIVKLDSFIKYVRPWGGQIICTLPVIHTNFNKLKMSLEDLTQQTNGKIIDDSLIIVRK